MDKATQNETRNLGIAILVPLVALMATSAYVILTPEASSADTVVGRLVSGIVLAFFVWNCVLSFQKGRFVSEDGDPSKETTEESRIGPIWAFVCALAVLGIIVSLSGPSHWLETWQARLGSGSTQSVTTSSSAPASPSSASGSARPDEIVPVSPGTQLDSPPNIGADGVPITPAPIEASGSYPFLQLVFTLILAGILGFFSAHISRLDNKISDRETALISHSIIYFVITFLNVLVLGSPLVFGFLSASVPDTIFTWAFNLRLGLLGLGTMVLALDALRVFSASYRTMRAIVERARFSLPSRSSVSSGVFSAIFLIVFLIGRVVLMIVNFFISIFVWVYVLIFYFIASCLKVVRATIFSWALLFALIHSIAFGLLALALLNSPWALTHIRVYFATADNGALIAIATAVSGVLAISVLMAVIAFVSAYFSWPTAFLTTIPELIAYTLIAVWLNSTALHIVKAFFHVGSDHFGSFAKLGGTFCFGIVFGVVAFFVALFQSSNKTTADPLPA